MPRRLVGNRRDGGFVAAYCGLRTPIHLRAGSIRVPPPSPWIDARPKRPKRPNALESPLVDFITLAQQCAPDVHPTTLTALVRTESGFNPYAIGVVAGRLERQPATLEEAVATAEQLQRDGFDASFGLGQVNLRNLARFSLDLRSVFDPCRNLRASAAILSEAYARARRAEPNEQKALRSALSMYYSGNAVTGVQHGYVGRVVGAAGVKDAADPGRRAAPIAPIAVIRNAGTASSRAASNVASVRPRGPVSRPEAGAMSDRGSASLPASSSAIVPAGTRAEADPRLPAFKPEPMW